MPQITLTTDFGTRDHYAGALKGALMRRLPGVSLVDISHEIQPFDIVQAAFTARFVWPEFPEGTLHLLAVHCIYAPQFRFLAARAGGHFFLAPDNGLLSLLFDHLPESDFRILPTPHAGSDVLKEIFADAAAHLLSGQPFDALGEPGKDLVHRISLQPVITPHRIRGTVIHIDNYDNAVINISREVFDKVCNDRPFSLFFKRNDPLHRVSLHYCDVPVGEPLCLFNSAGFLEIAINMGKAATLLGLKVEDVVEVEFS